MLAGRYKIGRRPTAGRPKCDDDEGDYDYEPFFLEMSVMVHEPDEEYVFSGLLDQSGEPIMVRTRDPIGFTWHDDNGELWPRHYFTGEGGEDEAVSPDPPGTD